MLPIIIAVSWNFLREAVSVDGLVEGLQLRLHHACMETDLGLTEPTSHLTRFFTPSFPR
jgi:hypothetical protein